MGLVCAVQTRWVLDWSLDPCYLGEFSGLIIKLVFIFPLICRIIILICMYLPGLLSQAHFLAVSELDQRLQLELGYILLSYCSPLCFCQREAEGKHLNQNEPICDTAGVQLKVISCPSVHSILKFCLDCSACPQISTISDQYFLLVNICSLIQTSLPCVAHLKVTEESQVQQSGISNASSL